MLIQGLPYIQHTQRRTRERPGKAGGDPVRRAGQVAVINKVYYLLEGPSNISCVKKWESHSHHQNAGERPA